MRVRRSRENELRCVVWHTEGAHNAGWVHDPSRKKHGECCMPVLTRHPWGSTCHERCRVPSALTPRAAGRARSPSLRSRTPDARQAPVGRPTHVETSTGDEDPWKWVAQDRYRRSAMEAAFVAKVLRRSPNPFAQDHRHLNYLMLKLVRICSESRACGQQTSAARTAQRAKQITG